MPFVDNADQNRTDTIAVTLGVSNARRIDSRVLFALMDVEVQVAGVAFDPYRS